MRSRAVVFLNLCLIAALAGCGQPGDIDTFTVPPISSQPGTLLFVITPPTSLAVNATITLSAAVTNYSANALISWSATCGAGACGSFSSGQTQSGGNTNYVAPSVIPSGATVTIRATLVGDTTQSVSAKITITPPQPIVVSFLGVPPASLQVSTTVPLSAQITNDTSSSPQVKWTVTCASAACGSFNPVTTNNEAATNYTTPPAVPTGNSVTVTATSVTDSTKSVSATIAITQTAATLANGTYVFQLSGPVGTSASSASGVIVAAGGLITGGEQDFVSYAFDQNAQEYVPVFDPNLNGSYTTTADGNVQISINTNDVNVGIGGVETINGVIVSGSRVLLTELNGSIASGTLDLQTSITAPSGGYAFTIAGVDLNGQPAGIGGILDIDTSGIVPANSVLDINDGFVISPAQTLAATAVSSPDPLGRIEIQLMPGASSTFPSIFLAGYIVDASHIRLVETANDQFQGVMGGTALGQASTGGFTSSSIAGSNFVFGASGEEVNGGSLQTAGVLIADGSGGLTGTLNWNDLSYATTQSPINFTGSYAVDPSGTGRVTLSNVTDGSTFHYQLELYLTGSGQGLLLSSSTSQMIAGRAFQQQAGPFSFSGDYGLSATEVASSLVPFGANAAVGPITVAAGSGTNTLAGFVDFGSGATDFPVTGTATTASTGIFTGTLAGLNSAAHTTPNSFAFYFVDSAQALMIETDNTQLTLGYLLQQ